MRVRPELQSPGWRPSLRPTDRRAPRRSKRLSLGPRAEVSGAAGAAPRTLQACSAPGQHRPPGRPQPRPLGGDSFAPAALSLLAGAGLERHRWNCTTTTVGSGVARGISSRASASHFASGNRDLSAFTIGSCNSAGTLSSRCRTSPERSCGSALSASSSPAGPLPRSSIS